jgi:hypothetical protein
MRCGHDADANLARTETPTLCCCTDLQRRVPGSLKEGRCGLCQLCLDAWLTSSTFERRRSRAMPMLNMKTKKPMKPIPRTAVLAYGLSRQLRPRNPLIADLSTIAAVGYALAGGAGAAILAMVAPMLMHAYTEATTADQALIAAEFAVVLQVCGVPSGNSWTPSCGSLVARNRVAPPPRSSRPIPPIAGTGAAAAAAGAAANVAGLSAMPRIMAHDPISAASTRPMNACDRQAKQIA